MNDVILYQNLHISCINTLSVKVYEGSSKVLITFDIYIRLKASFKMQEI